MKQLYTPWGESIHSDYVLNEYPRPQLKRNQYIILNGLWDYSISDNTDYLKPDGKILVPFSPESVLSGVSRFVSPNQYLFYHKDVDLPDDGKEGRWIIHFDAVDQEANLWINDREVGHHLGGFTPFSFDITDHICDSSISILLRVQDLSDTSDRQTGKQRINRGGIFYTPQSGIWQTVWLEKVPTLYITDLWIEPDFDSKSVKISIETNEPSEVEKRILISLKGKTEATVTTFQNETTIFLDSIDAWSPDHPSLYDLSIDVEKDHVDSYFGMRKFERKPDSKGVMRFYLNNQPTFLSGVLDQGYYPDGLLTPPSDEAMIFDIMSMKSLGFNLIRKHIKIEPLRWYYHCDRLGMVVWQDMVSGSERKDIIFHGAFAMAGISINDRFYHLFGRKSKTGRDQFIIELKEMVMHLKNTVSISTWVPFNEAWGQFDSKKVTLLIQNMDASRLIDHASGWHDQRVGDYKSLHIYFTPIHFRKRWGKKRILALTEFGGYSWMIEDHSFHPEEVFGYRKYTSQDELRIAIHDLYENQVIIAVENGLSVLVYTQLSDVEDEVNGFLTYDRKFIKVDLEEMLHMNQILKDTYDNSL